MLSAVVRRPSRDVNIMKEKLIISGAAQIPLPVFNFLTEKWNIGMFTVMRLCWEQDGTSKLWCGSQVCGKHKAGNEFRMYTSAKVGLFVSNIAQKVSGIRNRWGQWGQCDSFCCGVLVLPAVQSLGSDLSMTIWNAIIQISMPFFMLSWARMIPVLGEFISVSITSCVCFRVEQWAGQHRGAVSVSWQRSRQIFSWRPQLLNNTVTEKNLDFSFFRVYTLNVISDRTKKHVSLQ